ncbi:MAG: sodium:solute symporter family protein [Candidatus Omnitrophota bacterium]|nr:sodium:solute symporter family protein [Candidatus Omnitrophota bacterium]
MLIDLAILGLFVIYAVVTGLRARKQASKNLEEYFLAGRSLSGWQAGVSMAATQYAADTPLLVTGLVATAGVFSLWRLWIYAIAFLMLGFFFSGGWRRSGVLTDAEFTELRYRGKAAGALRALKAIHLGTLFNCSVLAMVLIAAVRISEPFVSWHTWLPGGLITPVANALQFLDVNLSSVPLGHSDVWNLSASNLISILMIVSFTTLYSTTGGLRAVVATDMVQFAIAMIATLIYAWIVVSKVGGLPELVRKMSELYGDEASRRTLAFFPARWDLEMMPILGVLFVQWFAQSNADGSGYLAQRTMACKTDKDARNASIIFTFLQVVVRSLFWLPIAIGLLVLYPAAGLPGAGEATEAFRVGREATFALGIRDFLPAGIRGLMLTGLLAALASTVDTHLNWGASYWTHDLYERHLAPKLLKREPSTRELVWVARFSNVGLITLALFIMARLSSIQAAWHITLLFGSGLGVVLILRWIWWRINIWSEYAAALSSIILAPILLTQFPELGEGGKLLAMVFISTFAVVGVTLLTKPEQVETLVLFYQRVKPPGFWGPIAQKAGDSSETPLTLFKKALVATALTSFVVFALLYIGCKLLFG